jgi:hypothetical protein
VIRSGNEGNRFGCLVIRYLLNRYDHRWQAFYRWLSEEKKPSSIVSVFMFAIYVIRDRRSFR